jgi:hypothetical protein
MICEAERKRPLADDRRLAGWVATGEEDTSGERNGGARFRSPGSTHSQRIEENGEF